MSSLIVKHLAKLPARELEDMRKNAQGELERVQVELRQIDEALKKQRPSRTPVSGPNSTRNRVKQYVADHGPVRPSEVFEGLSAEGETPKSGAIHNMMGRLVQDGDLVRVGDGFYELASNGSASQNAPPEAQGNGNSEPLSMAPRPQEGQT